MLTFGKGDPGHVLRSGQTDGVQEVEGPVATSPQVKPPPEALPASSYLQWDRTQRHQIEDANYEGRWGRDGLGQVVLQTITGRVI